MKICQKSIWAWERVGKKNLNAGTIIFDVSFAEKTSVEKKKVVISQIRTGS
jgi:hypothetical protein